MSDEDWRALKAEADAAMGRRGRDLAADLALVDAASPGPWTFRAEGDDACCDEVRDARGHVVADNEQYYPTAVSAADLRFIAAAREGWPAALREVEYQRAVIDGYATAFDDQNEEVERLLAMHAAACDRIAAQSDALSRTAEGRAVALLEKLRRLGAMRPTDAVAFEYAGADGATDGHRFFPLRLFHAPAHTASGQEDRWVFEGHDAGPLCGLTRMFVVDRMTLDPETKGGG